MYSNPQPKDAANATQTDSASNTFVLNLTKSTRAAAIFAENGDVAVAGIKSLTVVGKPTYADFKTIRTAMATKVISQF